MARTAWARRSATVSGRAPPSLIDRRRPPGERRSTKSAITACQTSPKPTAAVWISTSQSVPPSTRSTSTSRLPEATTPTSAEAASPAALPRGMTIIEPFHSISPAGASPKAGRNARHAARLAAAAPEGTFAAHLTHQFRNREGGAYRPPDQCTRSFTERAASRRRSASSGSMPRSSGRRITPRSRSRSTSLRSRPRPISV